MPNESQELIAAEELLNLMIARATGGDVTTSDYRRARNSLLGDPTLSDKLPRLVRTCRDPDALWGHIQPLHGTYAERRAYLRREFEPLLAYLESHDRSPLDGDIAVAAESLDSAAVSAAWVKASSRRATDPDGAITAARTLLESVCKTILEDRQIPYDDRRDDLPRLYGRVSKALKLAPSDHTEEQFRAILGGCTTVVNGLGAIRNRASDAHGQGRRSYRPAPRHAALAVNLAGSMALFLMDTHESTRA